ncbi:cytochrome b/b6 domain-containing protein [Marivita sp. GX14005]|uniref:cytochrome b/b6 domain-containing protein n=1 Tax=Marivita sp. GX14005 TaxID=2942276 RepID=UPI0020196332|nr:cytochrome b/b6 domain-containing protein [Marivita sp. GX14005]MCL3883474.1 cytochrome b/b6 domain-containing protein [Marivita sp. GX14005]
MPAGNTANRYGWVAKSFHWSIALGIFLAIPLGIVANRWPYDTAAELADKAWLFSLHKTLGVTILFVALGRIGWALIQPRPAPLHPERRWETRLAEIVHWLLYGSLVLVPLSGWVHHAATTGFAPILWPLGQSLPLVPKSVALAEIAAGLHIVFERVLVISVLLHVAGAIKHAVLDRDKTLARMLPGQPELSAPAEHRRSFVPPLAALGIWAAALGIGNALGVFHASAPLAAQAPALQAAAGDWRVTEGSLNISVIQMGSDVTGSFADWTADIAFDENVEKGPAGSVEVQIAITSLSLGSVTSQAMGADYFDAETHPTALFEAEILRDGEGYIADGTLRLRGMEQPVALPFTLDIQGDTARMSGGTTLDRRDFGIGSGMTDAAQLGFEVRVDVDLTATRAE